MNTQEVPIYFKATNLCRIRVKADNRYLHADDLGDQLVSTRAQVNDDYTRFYLEPQLDSSGGRTSYRIRVKADNRYLHADDLGDQLVSTRAQVNDDYTRFYLECSAVL